MNINGRLWEKTYNLSVGDQVEDAITLESTIEERWDIQQPGNLYITSDPQGAIVFLNQVEQGTTPMTLEDVQPGVYQIEVSKELYLSDSRTVEVNSLEFTDASFELKANFGSVQILSHPSGATAWINDHQRGVTPLEIPRFNAGTYALPDYIVTSEGIQNY